VINRIFTHRRVAKNEVIQANEGGIDPPRIVKYSALRKSIDGDKNLLAILKKIPLNVPSHKGVPVNEPTAVSRPGEKVLSDEQRFHKAAVPWINDKFNTGT
jgi:hypothetical protein